MASKLAKFQLPLGSSSSETATATDYFERALELQPEASSIHHALGLAYRDLGDLEQAESHLSRGGDAAVLFKDPLLSSLTELGRSAELYLVRAAQAFSAERYDQAEPLYRKALEIDPANFTTRKALGFCLEKLGDVEGAAGQLEEGLRTGASGDPARDALERSELLRILGGLRVLQGREPEAIDAFQRSLEMNPERLDTRSKLANALARQGRLEDAASGTSSRRKRYDEKGSARGRERRRRKPASKPRPWRTSGSSWRSCGSCIASTRTAATRKRPVRSSPAQPPRRPRVPDTV